jgi:hypothetical protein
VDKRIQYYDNNNVITICLMHMSLSSSSVKPQPKIYLTDSGLF